MRWILALTALLAASAAHAEMIAVPVEPVEHGHTLAISAGMDATHIHGFQAGAFGADLELGWRHGKLELYSSGEVTLLQFWPISGGATGVAGRLGGGLRWYPRGHGSDVFGMLLQLGGGLEAYAWDDQHVMRPDVELGIGYEIRAETLRFRVVARLYGFSDDNRNGIACRGCVTTSTAPDVGLGMTMGAAW